MKVCVLLPAYNEAKEIGRIIEQVKSYGLDVIVVDDGSTDNTAEVSGQAKATVLSHSENRGKGQSLRTGFQFVKQSSFDAVIIMDADGQHLPGEIDSFIECAKRSNAGIIIGNRMSDPQGMPFIRRMTNKITSAIVSAIVKNRIPDSQCGFRLIRSEVIKKLNLTTAKYETESEILFEAAGNGFSIESIPIKSVYKTDNKSLINPFSDTLRFCSLISKNIFRKK